MPAALAVAGKRSIVLMPARCSLAEYKRNDWVVNAEVGTTIEDILDPGFWAHKAPEFQPYDHIEVRPDDEKWIAYLVVLFAEKNYARVVLDRVLKIEQNTEAPETSVQHKVEWKGPHHKFCVIRISDSAVVHSGFVTRDEAATKLRQHESTMGV